MAKYQTGPKLENPTFDCKILLQFYTWNLKIGYLSS